MTDREAFEAWIKDSSPIFIPALLKLEKNGTYSTYSTRRAWESWQAATAAERERCIGIIEQYRVPVGNSSAGELAATWTMDSLKEIRDAIRKGE